MSLPRLLPVVLLVWSAWTHGAPATPEQSAALRTLQDAAAAGDAVAQYKTGDAYFDGNGVEKDWQQALLWYRRAALQGNRDAQYQLGRLLEAGRGGPDDAAGALAWYEKSAANGNLDAHYRAGQMYLFGVGTPADLVAAARWFRLGAAAGGAASIERLGHMYLNGYGVERDAVKAAALFEQAVALGYGPASLQLAWCLEEGAGMARDEARAWVLDAAGAAKSDPFARKQLVMMLEDGRGGQSPGLGDPLEMLGYVALADDRFAEAIALLERALAVLKTGQKDTSGAAAQLGSIALVQDRTGAAERYFRAARTWMFVAYPIGDRAFARNEAALGPANSEVARNLDLLGQIWLVQADHVRAAPALARAWSIRRDADIANADKRATATRLATAYRALHRDADALVLDAWLNEHREGAPAAPGHVTSQRLQTSAANPRPGSVAI